MTASLSVKVQLLYFVQTDLFIFRQLTKHKSTEMYITQNEAVHKVIKISLEYMNAS